MIREQTHSNLAIGVILSLLVHASLVVWWPPMQLQMAPSPVPSELEVQLREWPIPAPAPPPQEPTTVVEAPPAERPAPVPPKPVIPPDTLALQEALQASGTRTPTDGADMRLPERPVATPELASPPDPQQIAQALRQAFPPEWRPDDLTLQMAPPGPGRVLPEHRDVPPLPTLERPQRQEGAPAPPVVASLTAPNPALHIQGPAAERQVIFQPPPPTATVDREIDIELRFWILPNGTVSRVIPLKKADPRLEALAINYLRHWRFSALPTDAGADEQWGIIPFKFRIR